MNFAWGNALNPEVIVTYIFSSGSYKVLFFTSRDLIYYLVLIFFCDEVGIEFVFLYRGPVFPVHLIEESVFSHRFVMLFLPYNNFSYVHRFYFWALCCSVYFFWISMVCYFSKCNNECSFT